MSFFRLDDLPEISLTSSLTIRVVSGEKSTLLLARLDKDSKVARHKHAHEQLSYVLKGAIKVSVGDSNARDFVVREGEVSVMPPDVEHELSALEDTIDFFAPRREDLLKYAKPRDDIHSS